MPIDVRSRWLPVLATLALPGVVHAARLPVGVTERTFTKTSTTTGAPRVLATTIWYPAVRGTGTAGPLGLRDATVRRGRWPLVVFSHGACGMPTATSYLMKALAADGFIAAAPPHPGHTDADGNAVCRTNRIDTYLNRVPDLQFVVDAMLALDADRASPFARRVRRDDFGLMGVSFGGFTALLGGQREPRLGAVLAMVPGGVEALDPGDLRVPTMVIGSELDGTTGFPASLEAYARLAGPRYLVKLLGGGHLSVVDDCFPLCGTLGREEGHRLVVRYALPFFRRWLKDDRAASRALRKAVDGVELMADARRGRS
jgi:predicted dienelactone hydrolase